ncbi:hypothetical protein [Amycolatopsis sp. CA-230715]|uniref:hypothetical protein n=1 Tax=Amycolatopsis sp. CA-230715 TaxID=2745196 RepID=UPI001C030F81|nr:hypothetical protein [Amycolatopsis sp. CA-230715]QWF85732.1 hypothetical protein HUW46_09212 [Amycolatopsis sp. CA-230715]
MTRFLECEGSDMYPVRVEKTYVQRDRHGGVLCSMNTLAAEQLGHDGTRWLDTCPACRSHGYQITDDGTVRVHHRLG